MARLGRRLRDSVSVTYYSTLPSTSPTSSYHPNHSNRALTIRTHHSAKPHVEPQYMAACNFARRVVFFRSQITRISRIFHAACRGCFFAHRLHGLHGFSPCGLPAVVFRSRITQIARIFPHAACRRWFFARGLRRLHGFSHMRLAGGYFACGFHGFHRLSDAPWCILSIAIVGMASGRRPRGCG